MTWTRMSDCLTFLFLKFYDMIDWQALKVTEPSVTKKCQTLSYKK